MKTFYIKSGSVLFLLLVISCLAHAIGISTSGTTITVTTGDGLVFKVNNTNGDLISITYAGNELQSKVKFSQIASGLGSATVTSAVMGNYAVVTCTTSTLTHYYVAQDNVNIIYMATYVTAEPSVGELRYICRLDKSVLPNGVPAADLTNNTGAIEGSDVFGMADGTTRSKFYSNQRAIENLMVGATGNGIGAFMVQGNREKSTSGPFFRDIDNQGATQQEIYNYMNSGHSRTENFYRTGLYGPYALIITDGSTPSPVVDFSFMEGLGLSGMVTTANRGYVTGNGSGIVGTGYEGVVTFTNATAQYWTKLDAGTGNFSSPAMIPGDYTQTLYRGELAVQTQSVTVTAGTTVTSDITAANDTTSSFIFKIGNWDGTPNGFQNSDKITYMHPSDSRMNTWDPAPVFTVGSSDVSSFPLGEFKDVNNNVTISFTLSSDQVANRVFKIGTTLQSVGGRPVITVNSGTSNSWTSATPPAPQSFYPASRAITRGTYRGFNLTYTYIIPASALVAGTNTITITVASGSSGTAFLSPSIVFDALELD
jgi:rhamnogalacturonan endolyase